MKIYSVKRYGLAALFSVGLACAQSAAAQTATCKYVVTNSWGAGATASIEITNTGSTALNGWNVNWTYVNNRVTSSWNATLTGANPYSATNLSWNGSLQPGQSASFGVQVNTNGAVETPVVTGAVCSGAASSVSSASSVPSSVSSSSIRSSSSSVVSSSSRSSSLSSSSSSSISVASSSRSSSSVASSVASSSSSTSSVCASTGSQCNWYGTLYPSCVTTTSGWGYEDGKSCIATSTCAAQPTPFGVVGGSCGVSSSSSSVKSSSSVSSSSVKSSSSSSVSSSSSLSSSSVRSSSSSSVTSGVIPNATGAGVAYCRSADSDPDGDGWGWENSASCVVYGSKADTQGVGNFAYCVIGSSKLDLCTTDNGSWGSQSGKVCLSKSMCPGMGSGIQTAARSAPVNANANTTTKSVFTYLKSIWGNHVLSGQQDLTWQDNIDEYQRVINDTGKAPAIMGYDFMSYSLWAGNPGLQQTEEAITHWKRGGLVNFMWHWRDPDAAANTIGEFYTDKTKFTIPIANGQLDTTSASFTHIEANVAVIAAELKKLQTAGVTVLWRPLHESSGGWFWWGRADRTDGIPPAYAQVVLWRYLYDRLTNYYGLNNLIWVWNGQSGAWYPGDNYVDIVSTDIYDGAQNYKSQISAYNLTKSYPQESKMVALSENSNIPDPDLMKLDGAWWLYFLVWNDTDTAEGVTSSSNFWTGEYYNTKAQKIKVYNSDLVITLDELPKFQ